MKTLIIDWDFPPRELDRTFTELLSADYKIILTSTFKDPQAIKAELQARNLYSIEAKNLVILSSEPLQEKTDSKKDAATGLET